MAKNEWVIGVISPAVWPMFPAVPVGLQTQPNWMRSPWRSGSWKVYKQTQGKRNHRKSGEEKKKAGKKYQKCWDITLKKVSYLLEIHPFLTSMSLGGMEIS